MLRWRRKWPRRWIPRLIAKLVSLANQTFLTARRYRCSTFLRLESIQRISPSISRWPITSLCFKMGLLKDCRCVSKLETQTSCNRSRWSNTSFSSHPWSVWPSSPNSWSTSPSTFASLSKTWFSDSRSFCFFSTTPSSQPFSTVRTAPSTDSLTSIIISSILTVAYYSHLIYFWLVVFEVWHNHQAHLCWKQSTSQPHNPALEKGVSQRSLISLPGSFSLWNDRVYYEHHDVFFRSRLSNRRELQVSRGRRPSRFEVFLRSGDHADLHFFFQSVYLLADFDRQTQKLLHVFDYVLRDHDVQ